MSKQNTEPMVSVLWSEHPRLSNIKNLKISEADSLFRRIDNEEKSKGGYYKTSFSISCTIDGEDFSYTGRQDVGDGTGGLVDHIKADASYKRHSDFFDYYLAKKSDEVREGIMETLTFIEKQFIPHLNKFCCNH